MSFCLACTYRDDYEDHADGCTVGSAEAGAWWLGMLGFALAAPAATERAARLVDTRVRDAWLDADAKRLVLILADRVRHGGS